MRYTYFVNDLYALLKYLIENSYQEKNEMLFKGNQQTIAIEIHFSKQTTNKMMQSLSSNGFITLLDKRRGLYRIEDISNRVIETIEAEI